MRHRNSLSLSLQIFCTFVWRHAVLAAATVGMLAAECVWPFPAGGGAGLIAAARRDGWPSQASSQAPALDALLSSVGRYLSSYGPALSDVVAEESYRQVASGNQDQSRDLRSDVLFFTSDPARWVVFRDVFSVDGKAVRDRDDRVARLFSAGDSRADAWQQAMRIAQESARFNLNVSGVSVNRTLNVPIAALLFLRADNQHRSAFALARMDTIDGRPAAVVTFEERDMPRLFASQGNVAMHGAAWIDPASGRVLKTDLAYMTHGLPIQAGGVTKELQTAITIDVVFAENTQVQLWPPLSMDEQYDATIVTSRGPSGAEVRESQPYAILRGHAAYSNFHRFSVSVDTKIK